VIWAWITCDCLAHGVLTNCVACAAACANVPLTHVRLEPYLVCHARADFGSQVHVLARGGFQLTHRNIWSSSYRGAQRPRGFFVRLFLDVYPSATRVASGLRSTSASGLVTIMSVHLDSALSGDSPSLKLGEAVVQRELTWLLHPRRELLRLSGPMVLQLLSFSAMSFIDTLFVGRLGALVLGAVGVGSIVAMTIASFGSSVMVGARVEVGNHFGRGDFAAVRAALPSLLKLALGLGLASTAVGVGAAALLPHVLGDAQMGELAAGYLQIRALSYPAVIVASAVGQWLGAQGDARSPMVSALVANGLNAILNAWFVLHLGLGLRGSAWATLLAQGVEAALLLWFSASAFRQSAPFAGSTLARGPGMLHFFRLGVATGLERLLDMLAFSSVPLLLSYAGGLEVGVHQIALQVSLFAFLPTIALGDATTTLVSQAVGAGRFELVRKLRDEALSVGVIFAFVWGVLCFLLRVPLVHIFTSDGALVPSAHWTLIWVALLQVPNTSYNVLKGVLRGIQDFRAVALCAILCAWVISPPLTYVLAVRAGQGAAGAWQAFLVEVLVGVAYVFGRSRRLLEQPRSLGG
jgi:multidrug resistance protein, MATE family